MLTTLPGLRGTKFENIKMWKIWSQLQAQKPDFVWFLHSVHDLLPSVPSLKVHKGTFCNLVLVFVYSIVAISISTLLLMTHRIQYLIHWIIDFSLDDLVPGYLFQSNLQ